MNTTAIDSITQALTKYKLLSKSPNLFIKEHKLTEYHMNAINAESLPIDAYYGTVYLIKGSSILEFQTSFCTEENFTNNEFNLCLTTNMNVINYFVGDFNEFLDKEKDRNHEPLIDMTVKNLSQVHLFMTALLRNKFIMYI